MSKVVLDTITSGYDLGKINTNFQRIVTALENTVSRDGTNPNSLSADLDLNGNRLINELASTGEGFIWEGAWLTATAYAVNNLVSNAGSTYICKTAHTSGTFATDLAASKWELVASVGASGAGSGDLVAANNLSDVANVATARSNLGLVIGTDVQAYDADLAAIAALAPAQGEVIYYNGSAWTKLGVGTSGQFLKTQGATANPVWADAGGKLVQVVEATPITSVISTTASPTIPYDDTVPQNTEGVEIITVSITPTSASNRLYIEFHVGNVGLNAAARLIVTLFQDSTAGALAVAMSNYSGPGYDANHISLVHEMQAGTTSATTFKIRLGSDNGVVANTNAVNGGSRIFGGTSAVRLRVSEIKV